jgi:hypothetical protein
MLSASALLDKGGVRSYRTTNVRGSVVDRHGDAMKPQALRQQWRVNDHGPAIARSSSLASAPSCLADEIAIDFPSVGEAVARMRIAFGDDEQGAPLRTEILLSAGQAGRGVAVPLEVPVRHTCGDCGGRGETWGEPCGLCLGSGYALVRHQLTVSVPPGVTHGEQFSFSLAHPRGPRTRIELRVAVT